MIQQFQFWVVFQRKQRYQIKMIHVLYIYCTSFKTVNTRKQSKSLPIDKWTKKMHFTDTHTLLHTYIYTMEYYSARKNEILLLVTRIDFEGIPLNEISQPEKDKNWVISLICEILKKKRNLTNTEMRLMIITSGKGYGVVEMQEGGQKVQKLSVVSRIMIPSSNSYPDLYDS